MTRPGTAVAVAVTVALFRIIGPKRTRLTAQVLAAIIGAAFVIGLQVAAILSYGTLSRADVLQSQTLEALAPDLGSVFWWPARAQDPAPSSPEMPSQASPPASWPAAITMSPPRRSRSVTCCAPRSKP
jgi:glucose-6-phosphate dehydrogenase assembly protein OpcA